MKKYVEKLIIILGSAIVAFGIYNIHSKCNIAEGGELGIELLMYNWFLISPAIVSLVFDIISYIIGSIVFGKKFLLNAIVGTISYSFFYLLFENIPCSFFDLSNQLLLASIIGGCFVGIGCGLVVRYGGACGGDDSIALIMSKIIKLPVSVCYFVLDIFVLIISLSYIKVDQIIYSLLTAMISSVLIGYVSKMKKSN